MQMTADQRKQARAAYRRNALAMQTATMRKAFRLYEQYKTTTAEYAALAERMCLTPTDLNVRCSELRGRIFLMK